MSVFFISGCGCRVWFVFMVVFFFFFFQAEDGIRDWSVTGVQTCALPISKAFPIIKDLVVDRTAFDRIQQAGGYVSVNTGGVPDANEIPIPKKIADEALDRKSVV